jgi:hypothetical protein
MRLVTAQRDSDRLYMEYHVTSILFIVLFSFPFPFPLFPFPFSLSSSSFPRNFTVVLINFADMERSNEALVTSNEELKKQLETISATLLALQEQMAKLTGDSLASMIRADESNTSPFADSSSSSSAQPISTYNTRSKKGR